LERILTDLQLLPQYDGGPLQLILPTQTVPDPERVRKLFTSTMFSVIANAEKERGQKRCVV
jgi:hypothetical protein